jgi:glucose-1-phosphate cytidylyltransferase
MSVPVMLLCGGMGTRLREETEYRPKPMVEIGGRPILWHIMKLYAQAGHEDFVLCLGYKAQMIKEFFLNYRPMVCDFTIDIGGGGGDITLHDLQTATEHWKVTCADTGLHAMTGARVRKALRYVDADTFCLTYGDGLSDVDLAKVVAFHKAHGRVATLTAVQVASRFGELDLSGEGRVRRFAEKPEHGEAWINGGFFVLDRKRIEAYLPEGDDLVFERGPLEALAGNGELVAYRHDGFWQAMDTYREWQMLEELWTTNRAPWATWKNAR